MKVILTQNVPKLGEVGDVCQVAPGYGRNYLIPQGMAMLATRGALKQIEDLKRTEHHRQLRMRSEMEQLGDRIAAQRLSFKARVGETGRLYGSITATDIAEALAERLGEPIDRRKIELDESLRTLGEHEVSIHLMPHVDTHVIVTVEAEAELVEDVGLTEELESVDAGPRPAAVGESAGTGEATARAPGDEGGSADDEMGGRAED